MRHAKQNAVPARLTLSSGVLIELSVAVVGHDVVSGTTGGATHGAVVPFGSISWIEVATEAISSVMDILETPDSAGPTARYGDFFDNSSRLSHSVTCYTASGAISGLIVAVASGVVVLRGSAGRTRALASAQILWFSVDV